MRPLIEQAGTAAAERLRLSVFARVYFVGALVLAGAIAYLMLAAQATQSSYELSRLQAQHAQLQADQDQLRFQSLSMHAPARVAEAAAAAGMQRPATAARVGYQPPAVDLGRPIGPDQPAADPLWQRALAAAAGAHDALASGG